MLLLASLGAWIIFTLPLGFIQPPATSCIERKNATDFELRTPQVPRILKRSIDESMLEEIAFGRLLNDSEAAFTRYGITVISFRSASHSILCFIAALGWNVQHGQ